MRDTVDSLLVSVDEAAELVKVRRTEARQRETEAREEATRIARERPINFFVPAELVGGEEGDKLGPVTLQAGETVKAAEGKVMEWLENEGEVEEVVSPEGGGFFGGYLREARRRGRGSLAVGRNSSLLELQEIVGVSDEVLLQIAFEA